MRDYQAAYDGLSLPGLAGDVLQGSLDDGINAAIECCDRWTEDGRIALNWIGQDFVEEAVTFATLRDQSARFAGLLRARGIGRGDVVGGLLPRIPELLMVALGAWRAGAIYQPLFTAFGPAAITSRVTSAGGSQAKLIVTDAANRPKLDDVANCPPVLVVDRGRADAGSFAAALASQPSDFAPVMLRGTDPFIILFTSGTTGSPKGVRYPLSLLLPTAVYMQDGIDLRPEDRFWNVADPGWAYGMLYTVVGPLLLGHATTFFESGFTVDGAVRVIAEQHITNLAAAPTVYRLMMAAGDDAIAPVAGQLRIASSAGEPLNPEVVRWAERVLRVPVNDHYGQTETAMLVNNHHGLRHKVKLGAAGLAMPGFALSVLDDQLHPVPPDTPGVLAVHRKNSPLFFFDGYWNAETPSFQGDWYLTGDTMQQDAEGHFFFVGRNDDIITSAGYRIGPFDVESVIIEHPAVAEVAVVGKPDPERTEIVKAFIVLRPGIDGSDLLKAELQQHVRTRLSLHAYPREIAFLAELPKTPSGKVQRFLLRQQS
jgi:acetyl-CoA synthetase